MFLAQNPAAPPPHQKVIIRVFGRASLLFSRRQEVAIFLSASHFGVGPQLLLEFGNGRVEEFLPGEAVTARSLREPAVAAAVAASLADFHVRMMGALPLIRATAKPHASSTGATATAGGDTMKRSPSMRSDDSVEQDALWGRLRGWLAAVDEIAAEEAAALGIGGKTGEEEIYALQHAVQTKFGPPWLAFNHNDLQYGNILLQASNEHNNNDEGSSSPLNNLIIAKLIDYEYSTVGDVAFDVANHFCEYAADYHLDASASSRGDGDDGAQRGVLDWSRLPSAAEQMHFCREYVNTLHRQHPDSTLMKTIRAAVAVSDFPDNDRRTDLVSSVTEEKEVLDAAAVVLVTRATAFAPLSHLKWGLWALIQCKLSDISEFDYLGYATARLEQYHVTKNALLLQGA